jgi:hypothetical protein
VNRGAGTMEWNLAPGTHTVTFYGREAHTALDKVALVGCPAAGCAALRVAGCGRP